MKTKTISLALASLFLVTSCTGKSKQPKAETLWEDTIAQNSAKLEELYSTEEVVDTIIPNPGIKYAEKRDIDSKNPPVTVNIENSAENKELDLSQFYSQVEYVKLKHPLSENGIAFLGNSHYEILYENGATSGRGANSRVYFGSDKLIAGDNFYGFHCFDLQGKYLYTVAAKNGLPAYDLKSNTATMHYTPDVELIIGFSVLDDNCLISKAKQGKITYYFHNLGARKNYLQRPATFQGSMLISPDAYIDYTYNPAYAGRTPILQAFDIKGDTLSQFINYNPLADIGKGTYTNIEDGIFYRYGNLLTMRQAYNDTIFRVSANKLTPAFVLNLGNKKPDVQTALKGDKKGKIFIEKLLETEDFLFIVHTEDYDCPNNRKSGAVKFFYSYFDKKAGKRYSVPSAVFPEVFTLKNSLVETIPLSLSNATVYKDKLYSSYTKTQLKEIIASEAFASFPAAQQEKLKTFAQELSDYELLVMILKK